MNLTDTLQIVTLGVVAALSKPTLSTLSTYQSPATTRLQSTSIRTVDGRGSALPAPDEPEIRAYFTGVGLFSYFSQSGFGQPLLFQYRILATATEFNARTTGVCLQLRNILPHR